MNKEQLKDIIREVFPTGVMPAFYRFYFILMELGHAAVNITREILRAMGAPEAPGDDRNWADEVSRWGTVAIALAVFALLVWLVMHSTPPPLFVDE